MTHNEQPEGEEREEARVHTSSKERALSAPTYPLTISDSDKKFEHNVHILLHHHFVSENNQIMLNKTAETTPVGALDICGS